MSGSMSTDTGANREHCTCAHRAAPPHVLATRLSWGLADQAVSSVTQLRGRASRGPLARRRDFGVFSLAWVTYGVVLNISRGLATDPLVVRFSGVAGPPGAERWAGRRAPRCWSGSATGLWAWSPGSPSAARSARRSPPWARCCPCLLLQDAWRFAFFAAGRGRPACLNDVVWGVALVPALVLAAQQGSVVAFVLAWGASAAVAAAYGCVQSGTGPGPEGAGRGCASNAISAPATSSRT